MDLNTAVQRKVHRQEQETQPQEPLSRTSPNTTPPIQGTFFSDNRNIFNFLTAFGLVTLLYDPHTDRVHHWPTPANCAVLFVALNAIVACVLFVDVQLKWAKEVTSIMYNIPDLFRSSALVYQYAAMFTVSLLHRNRYVAFFNHLSHVDRVTSHLLGDHWPSATITTSVRHSFWSFCGTLLVHYLFVSMPLRLYLFGTMSVKAAAFMGEYNLLAIQCAVTTALLRFAAQCCLERSHCLRDCLRDALTSDDERSVRTVLRALHELDGAKELLNDGFGTLLMCKLAIDELNVVSSVYLMIHRMLHNDGIGALEWVEFTLYELPYVVADVLMVRTFKALGDEVSDEMIYDTHIFVLRYLAQRFRDSRGLFGIIYYIPYSSIGITGY